MDGTVPCMQGMEHVCGGAGGTGSDGRQSDKGYGPQRTPGKTAAALTRSGLMRLPERLQAWRSWARVLGGGIVAGSLVLVGGDPGIGKSTLLLQVCRNLTAGGDKVLYVSGEESQQQIKLRANRMGRFSDRLLILCETNLEDIRETIQRVQPPVVVIDSIQTMYNESVSSAPGSVSQVRESTGVLMQIAKGLGVTIFIVGHVTKEGVVAGPGCWNTWWTPCFILRVTVMPPTGSCGA